MLASAQTAECVTCAHVTKQLIAIVCELHLGCVQQGKASKLLQNLAAVHVHFASATWTMSPSTPHFKKIWPLELDCRYVFLNTLVSKILDLKR